jgi:hypothetical protein
MPPGTHELRRIASPCAVFTVPEYLADRPPASRYAIWVKVIGREGR